MSGPTVQEARAARDEAWLKRNARRLRAEAWDRKNREGPVDPDFPAIGGSAGS